MQPQQQQPRRYPSDLKFYCLLCGKEIIPHVVKTQVQKYLAGEYEKKPVQADMIGEHLRRVHGPLPGDAYADELTKRTDSLMHEVGLDFTAAFKTAKEAIRTEYRQPRVQDHIDTDILTMPWEWEHLLQSQSQQPQPQPQQQLLQQPGPQQDREQGESEAATTGTGTGTGTGGEKPTLPAPEAKVEAEAEAEGMGMLDFRGEAMRELESFTARRVAGPPADNIARKKKKWSLGAIFGRSG
jgi:hypothetical protein